MRAAGNHVPKPSYESRRLAALSMFGFCAIHRSGAVCSSPLPVPSALSLVGFVEPRLCHSDPKRGFRPQTLLRLSSGCRPVILRLTHCCHGEASFWPERSDSLFHRRLYLERRRPRRRYLGRKSNATKPASGPLLFRYLSPARTWVSAVGAPGWIGCAIEAYFAVAVAVGHRDHRRILVDIEARLFIYRRHVLVSVSGCFNGCSHFSRTAGDRLRLTPG